MSSTRYFVNSSILCGINHLIFLKNTCQFVSWFKETLIYFCHLSVEAVMLSGVQFKFVNVARLNLNSFAHICQCQSVIL